MSRRVHSSNTRVEIWGTTGVGARPRRNELEEVVADTGIRPPVEDRPDHHRLAARLREAHVPVEVGFAFGAALDQGTRRHREEPGPGDLAEDTRDREQLVVVAHLARQLAPARAVVADHLVGRETECPEAQAVGHQLRDARHLLARRRALVRGIRPEHRGAHRHVTDERGEVAQHRELVEHAEVVGLGARGEGHTLSSTAARGICSTVHSASTT